MRLLGLAIEEEQAHVAASYSLTLAVYCTTWTFFGSIERATTGGFDFLQRNSVSIADFIAGRYGKSQAVAALVAVAAFVGIVPYVALQHAWHGR